MTPEDLDKRLAEEFEPLESFSGSCRGIVSPRCMWERDHNDVWIPRPFHDQDDLALMLVYAAGPHPPIYRTTIEYMADVVEVHVYDYDDKLIGRGVDDEICAAIVGAYGLALGILQEEAT